jgi:hypothetical protein
MKNTWKIVLTIVAVGLLAGAFIFYKIWYMPHRDVKDETAVTVTAQGIMDAYNADEKKANTLYLDKAIEVSGEVSDISKTQQGKTVLSLKTADPMGGVRCTMKDKADVKPGETVRIKGICSGFLMDVTLIDCYVVK